MRKKNEQQMKLFLMLGSMSLMVISGIAGLTNYQILRVSATVIAPTCEEQGKVTICHIPPGNPENPQTICVAPEAVDEHLAHGDYLGACKEPTPTPTTPPITPTPTPTTPPITPTPTPTTPPITPTPTPTPPITPTPTPTPTPPDAPMLQVNVLAPSGQIGILGTTLTYVFKVTNEGDLADRYQLTVKSEHQLKTEVTPDMIHLSPGKSKDVVVTLTLPLTAAFQMTRLTLTAVSLTDSTVHDDDSVITTIPRAEPAVEFTKTADKQILTPGEEVRYTLYYRNIGNIPLREIEITDPLPPELEFVESSWPELMVTNNTLRLTLEKVLSQGAEHEVTITTRVKKGVAPRGQIVNTATLTAEGLPEPVTARTASTIEVPNLQIEKLVNRSHASRGDILLYSITVTNTGSGAARAASIKDTLPKAMQYVPGTSLINGQRVADPVFSANQQAVWAIGDVQPGATVYLRYQVTVSRQAKNGTARNTATVAGQNHAGQPVIAGPVETVVQLTTEPTVFRSEIQASVFLDRNSNGQHDADEPGMSGIQVLALKNRARLTTDPAGKVVFSDVKPGEQAVALVDKSLPKGYRLTTEGTVLVTAPEGGIGYAEFGIQPGIIVEAVDDHVVTYVNTPVKVHVLANDRIRTVE